jgi:hypothetical protein
MEQSVDDATSELRGLLEDGRFVQASLAGAAVRSPP